MGFLGRQLLQSHLAFVDRFYEPNGCQPQNRGKTPKMDGENNGKPYEQMDDLGGFPTPIFGNTQIKMNTGSVLLV